MKSFPRTERSRRRIAVMACLVWLLGVEALPALHLAAHAWLPAHHHDGDVPLSTEMVVTVRSDATAASAHTHEGVLHRHGDARAHPRGDEDLGFERPDRAPDPGHGQHSLLHHTLALRAPAAALVHPLPVDRHVVPVGHAIAQLVANAPPPEAGARAPPV
jgi:hypothetical protein